MDGLVDLCMEKLTTLDLSGYEAAVYVSLLQQGEATALELAEHSDVPRQRVYDVLDSLCSKGFCRRTQDQRPRQHAVVAPERALPAMLEQRRRQQQAENERYARLIRELMTDLQAMQKGTDGSEIEPGGDGMRRGVGGL